MSIVTICRHFLSACCRTRLNVGHKKTTEDDKHPGNDHSQYQSIKVGLAEMF